MQNYYCNLKAYDERGKRVAVFGRLLQPTSADRESTTVEVFELYCSTKDQFTKHIAKDVYEQYLTTGEKKCNGCEFHPKIYTIEAEDPKRPKWSFLRHIQNNFYSQWTTKLEIEPNIKLAGVKVVINKNKNIVEIKTLERWPLKDR